MKKKDKITISDDQRFYRPSEHQDEIREYIEKLEKEQKDDRIRKNK